MQQIKDKCNVPVVPILYFYTTNTNCTDCIKQGAVLDKMRSDYPELRVYSFDYNLDLSALQTLIRIHKVDGNKLPAVYMNDKLYSTYQDEDDIKKILPELEVYAKARLKAEAVKKAKEETLKNATTSSSTEKTPNE